jgi:hypothetical protein
MSAAAAPAPRISPGANRADRWVSRAAGATVAGLAGIAGAISYSHMHALAAAHGDAGWHAHAFPLSVDGVEIVASLVLLADRRTGRRSGWLPWAALTTGTTASLAANIATAGSGIVSRIIAGWPALALLIAVKLLSGILEHRPAGDVPPLPSPARAGTPPATGPVPGPPARTPHRDRRPGRAGRPAAPATATRAAPRRSPARGRTVLARTSPAGDRSPGAAADLAAILPAARAARDERGVPLTAPRPPAP